MLHAAHKETVAPRFLSDCCRPPLFLAAAATRLALFQCPLSAPAPRSSASQRSLQPRVSEWCGAAGELAAGELRVRWGAQYSQRGRMPGALVWQGTGCSMKALGTLCSSGGAPGIYGAEGKHPTRGAVAGAPGYTVQCREGHGAPGANGSYLCSPC